MRKKIQIACIAFCIMFVFGGHLYADAAPSTQHGSSSVRFNYFLGSATAEYDWDYIYGKDITFSTGYAYGTGVGISASTYLYKKWDERVHFYKTIVLRGISIGGSVGDGAAGTGGGDIVWKSDAFYASLTAYGNCSSSEDELG